MPSEAFAIQPYFAIGENPRPLSACCQDDKLRVSPSSGGNRRQHGDAEVRFFSHFPRRALYWERMATPRHFGDFPATFAMWSARNRLSGRDFHPESPRRTRDSCRSFRSWKLAPPAMSGKGERDDTLLPSRPITPQQILSFTSGRLRLASGTSAIAATRRAGGAARADHGFSSLTHDKTSSPGKTLSHTHHPSRIPHSRVLNNHTNCGPVYSRRRHRRLRLHPPAPANRRAHRPCPPRFFRDPRPFQDV